MSMAAAGDVLSNELPGLVRETPLAPYCAYRLGGPAEMLYAAHTTEQLRHAVVVARSLGVAVTVLGRATNVLVSDQGLRGLVVLTRNAGQVIDGEVLTAGAGAVLPEVVAGLAARGLAGLEFAGNIPGSVGGAVVGNAGAYGRSIGDALLHARLLSGDSEVVAGPAELGFGYRSSALKRPGAAIVLEATFGLQGGGKAAALQAEIARDAELRAGKHPHEYGSCGSYFKNPSPEHPAARYIDEAGLKGFRLGKAEVSTKHANFLVALPGAGADDIRRLAAEVQRRVHEQAGVWLDEEVRLLGFADPGL